MVRYVSDDIGVMYLGQLVESSDSEEIYKNPLHPYTKGLLSCIPIADPKLARAMRAPVWRAICPARSTRNPAAGSVAAAPMQSPFAASRPRP